ncbi:MAG TPA: TonB-dependent receptor [Gammaproteobacteria bacterium]|jgi:vitamin B12 transporter|nr:TonB-dependent receptor [Gammaproteobacteria bacterium]
MKVTLTLLTGSAIALLMQSPTQGQTMSSQATENPLEEIVVVANRLPVPLKQIGTSVSVLDEQEIRAYGNSALTDVIRQLPAIGVSRSGGTGTQTSLRIRGEEGFRTLVLFDGLKLSDPAGTQVGPKLAHVMSAGIDKIEVLRGPQGLSYGADAGGVINISSRRDIEGLSGSLDGHSGKFGTHQLAASIGGGNDIADFYVTATDFETDGFNTRNSDAVLVDDDGYSNITVHARAGFNLGEGFRFDIVHRDVQGETEFDGCFSGTTVHDCDTDYDLEATRISGSYRNENMSHALAYSSTDSDTQNYALGIAGFSTVGELNRVEYIGSLNKLSGFNLIFGADFEEELANGEERDNEGYYVDVLSDFSDNFFFTAGVRQDDNDDFGSHTSYRISTAYLMDLVSGNTLKFKASFGTGFRAPSLSEIAYNSGFFAYPPASLVDLKEENSEGFEIGAEYFIGNDLRLEAVYFDQEVEDAIYFDAASFSGYLQDLGVSTSEGFELTANYSLNPNWQLQGNYTFNETKRPNGQQRVRRPEKLANVGVSYTGLNDRLNLNAFYRISKDAVDAFFGSPVDYALDDFEVLDITASFTLTQSIEIYARIENAFDEDYQEILDYNSPERASYIGVRASF